LYIVLQKYKEHFDQIIGQLISYLLYIVLQKYKEHFDQIIGQLISYLLYIVLQKYEEHFDQIIGQPISYLYVEYCTAKIQSCNCTSTKYWGDAQLG
jgi:hypothetical protein